MGLEEERTRHPPPPHAEVAPREDVRVLRNRCPWCHEAVRVDDQAWVSCRDCQARHHDGCWGEAGVCGACGGGVRLECEEEPPPVRVQAMLTYTWQVEGHEVRFTLGFGGREVVTVDGRVVVNRVNQLFGCNHDLRVGGRDVRLEMRVPMFVVRSRLLVDGAPMPPSEAPPEWLLVLLSLLILVPPAIALAYLLPRMLA